jgi:S-adenosylmethionine:diacylglycerol 3-amino-3-carboxypropyl transferase
MLWFQALSSRRFQHRFHWFNLRRLTSKLMCFAVLRELPSDTELHSLCICSGQWSTLLTTLESWSSYVVYRRKLKLQAKFDSTSKYFNFKRFAPGAFNVAFMGQRVPQYLGCEEHEEVFGALQRVDQLVLPGPVRHVVAAQVEIGSTP